jgi:hypothetical protein
MGQAIDHDKHQERHEQEREEVASRGHRGPATGEADDRTHEREREPGGQPPGKRSGERSHVPAPQEAECEQRQEPRLEGEAHTGGGGMDRQRDEEDSERDARPARAREPGSLPPAVGPGRAASQTQESRRRRHGWVGFHTVLLPCEV